MRTRLLPLAAVLALGFTGTASAAIPSADGSVSSCFGATGYQSFSG